MRDNDIGVPIIRGKPLDLEVGAAVMIVGWSVNKPATLMEPEVFPARVVGVFSWTFLDKETKKETTNVMVDVKFDSDTSPDPVPPHVRQPHMYGTDWSNILFKAGVKLPEPLKISAKLRKELRPPKTKAAKVAQKGAQQDRRQAK